MYAFDPLVPRPIDTPMEVPAGELPLAPRKTD